MNDAKERIYTARLFCLLGLGTLILLGLASRLFYLQTIEEDFLQTQGEARTLRTVTSPGYRGIIQDRHGEPLAISSVVYSVWVNPQKVNLKEKGWGTLAKILEVSPAALTQKIQSHSNRSFVYLARKAQPFIGKKVAKLTLSGVNLEKDLHRFYPTGEVSAHVVGFTNIDEKGQEGLELAFDDYLKGQGGKAQILRDGKGQSFERIGLSQKPKNGGELTLSLDRRFQFIAYKELKKAYEKHRAQGASVVMLDPRTNEVLAMANLPSFNPNAKYKQLNAALRNRAVTDQFEPGSVMKAFSMATILSSGQFAPSTTIDTQPGWITVGNKTVKDVRNFGSLTLDKILQKSSNVGISKLILSLKPDALIHMFQKVGFGYSTGSGFPGESQGILTIPQSSDAFSMAALSFGYGVAVTPLQLAQAYSILASKGAKKPVRFLKVDPSVPLKKDQVLTPTVAQAVTDMLVKVTQPGGSGVKARVPGVVVAGKTGTVKKVGKMGYLDNQFISVFAGYAPAHDPQIVLVVVVDNPSVGQYYGGDVAAPVFSNIMQQTLRLMNRPNTQSHSQNWLAKK